MRLFVDADSAEGVEHFNVSMLPGDSLSLKQGGELKVFIRSYPETLGEMLGYFYRESKVRKLWVRIRRLATKSTH